MLKKHLQCVPIILAIFLLSSCDVKDRNMGLCSKGIPTYTDLFQNPIFSSLQYHKRTPYDYAISLGYDFWADSKFAYTAGLQFDYVHMDETNLSKNCVKSDVLRVTLPLNENQKAMLATFSEALTKSGGFDRNQIQNKLNELLKKGGIYQPIAQKNHVVVNAGMVRHPFRGDFFVVSAETKS